MATMIIISGDHRLEDVLKPGMSDYAERYSINGEEYEFIEAAHETFKAKRAAKRRNSKQTSHLDFSEIDANYYAIVTRFGSMANYYASRANIDYASNMFRK